MTIRTDLANLQMLLGNVDAGLDDIASGFAHLSRAQCNVLLGRALLCAACAALAEAEALADAPTPILVDTIDDDAAADAIGAIPPSVLAVSPGAPRLKLRLSDTSAGRERASAFMFRLGWREGGLGLWHRPGWGAAALSHLRPEQDR